jgi:pimeloyl-ACP methyl ester carboxylesterase
MTTTADAVGAPTWFRHAISISPTHREHDVSGCSIHYRVWGPPERPGLILIHGGGAHSGWWDHVGPLLDTHRVVALDLSGHGDSGWRDSYGLPIWADEVMAVAEAEGLDRPMLAGHSMGGWVAASTAVRHGSSVGSVIIIDSPANDQPPEEETLRRRRQPTRVYVSSEAAVARFRTVPEQEVMLPYIARHVAQESVRPVDGGWTWKFDPARVGRRVPMRELLPQIHVPVTLLRCEQGLVSDGMARDMARLVDGGARVIALPAAGHHPMFDQPLALVTALRSLLAP